MNEQELKLFLKKAPNSSRFTPNVVLRPNVEDWAIIFSGTELEEGRWIGDKISLKATIKNKLLTVTIKTANHKFKDKKIVKNNKQFQYTPTGKNYQWFRLSNNEWLLVKASTVDPTGLPIDLQDFEK